MLAKVYYAVAATGLLVIVPGIVMALDGGGTALAKIGSVLTVLSILMFQFTVFRHEPALSASARRRLEQSGG